MRFFVQKHRPRPGPEHELDRTVKQQIITITCVVEVNKRKWLCKKAKPKTKSWFTQEHVAHLRSCVSCEKLQICFERLAVLNLGGWKGKKMLKWFSYRNQYLPMWHTLMCFCIVVHVANHQQSCIIAYHWEPKVVKNSFRILLWFPFLPH